VRTGLPFCFTFCTVSQPDFQFKFSVCYSHGAQNRKAVRKCSQEPPIFIGPIVLYSDGRFATYHHFFSAISAALNGTALASSELVCDGLVVGSGEELAMVSAAKSAFPRANH